MYILYNPIWERKLAKSANSRNAENVNKLLSWGYKEIVFTGVDITSYGNDLPGKPSLGDTIRRVLDIQPKLKRIRFSSIDPAEIDDELFNLFFF